MKRISSESRLTNVHPFLYLFTMDLARIPFQTYSQYEKKEPGFSTSFFEAYIAAFNEQMDGRLSHQLIKKINQIAMSHVPTLRCGQYRSISGNFKIGFEDYKTLKNPVYSASLAGFKEFISYWMIKPESPVHMIGFESKSDLVNGSFCLASENGELLWQSLHKGKPAKERFIESKHFQLIQQLSTNFDYDLYINTMSFNDEVDIDIEKKVETMMQHIFDEFHDEIGRVAFRDDKVTVIAKYIQRIGQLHPFQDGNIRTCYILLNKLLSDYGLSLSIMLNPNKLDACSLDEIVKMIKDGQVIYQQLINNRVPIGFLIETDETIEELRTIVCMPHDFNQPELMNSFCTAIIKRENTPCIVTSQRVHAAQTSTLQFFGSNEAASLIEVIRPLLHSAKCERLILTKLNNGEYACALRNACNQREFSIINAILAFSEKLKIDINQSSTNGNTALDWLDLSSVAVNPEQLAEVRLLLVEHGAVNKTQSRVGLYSPSLY